MASEPQRLPAGAAPEGVAQLLTLAFHDDPLMAWLLPDPVGRPRRLASMMESILRHDFLPRGEVWVLDGGAAACWRTPGESDENDEAMAAEMAALFGDDLARAAGFFAGVSERHPKDPHWYLGILGAVPERQGHGLGSALLKVVLDRADRDGVPAYLEATTPQSRRLYERHGFELVEEFHGPGGAPPLWLMWRQ